MRRRAPETRAKIASGFCRTNPKDHGESRPIDAVDIALDQSLWFASLNKIAGKAEERQNGENAGL